MHQELLKAAKQMMVALREVRDDKPVDWDAIMKNDSGVKLSNAWDQLKTSIADTEKATAELDQMMSDLLCSAFEGGSNYWYRIDDMVYPEGKTRADFKYTYLEVPLQGGSIKIKADDHENKKRADHLWILDREALDRGWQLMMSKQPRHYADAMTGNGDAITGDVFLQLCLFGEVIFG